MSFLLAQAVPSPWLLLWLAPFILLYSVGIPLGVFLAFNANLLVAYLPKTPFVALVWAAVLIPVFGLVPVELFRFPGAMSGDAAHRAMAVASVLLSLLALYRRSHIKATDSQEPPSRA